MTNNVYFLIGLDEDHRPMHTMRVAFPPGTNTELGLKNQQELMLCFGGHAKVIVVQEVDHAAPVERIPGLKEAIERFGSYPRVEITMTGALYKAARAYLKLQEGFMASAEAQKGE